MRISPLADTHLPSTIRDLWGEGREVFAGVDLMEPEEHPIVCLREVYPGGQPEQGKARPRPVGDRSHRRRLSP